MSQKVYALVFDNNFEIEQVRWKSVSSKRGEFSCESSGERILKIGPHLPKLLSNIKG